MTLENLHWWHFTLALGAIVALTYALGGPSGGSSAGVLGSVHPALRGAQDTGPSPVDLALWLGGVSVLGILVENWVRDLTREGTNR